jgi:hypothetical protein
MADVPNPTPHRFARQVAPTAPKPGHHLATLSFGLGNENTILWLIEGPGNDAFSFLGMATDFERTRILRFSVQGSLIERINDLPRSPYDRTLIYRFRPESDEDASRLRLQSATVVFSGMRSANGVDPDSAALAFDLGGDQRVLASVTGYQRGWYWQTVVVAVSMGVWAVRVGPTDGESLRLEVEQDSGPGQRFAVLGGVTYSESIMGSSLQSLIQGAPTAEGE